MNKWLSDEEISRRIPFSADEPMFIDRVCAQAVEANRLREGLKVVLQKLSDEKAECERHISDISYDEASFYPAGRGSGVDIAAALIRKLLEGGE